MYLETISFERMMEVTDRDIYVIRNDLLKVYAGVKSVGDYKVISEADFAELANAFNIIDGWSNYYNKYKDIHDSELHSIKEKNTELRIKINELYKDNIRLQDTVNKLDKDKNKLQEKNDSLVNSLNEIICNLQGRLESIDEILKNKNESNNELPVELVNMMNTLDNTVSLIEENAKALTLSRKLKTEPKVNKHGEEHPKFNNSVKNEELVKDYIELLKYNEEHPNKKEQKAVLKILSDKYGLSMPGIRSRLIALDVYNKKWEQGTSNNN